jgi:WD40 repeat protein
MASLRLFSLLLASSFSCATIAQSAPEFPKPNFGLADAKHKQGKSGVQIGPGNAITIVSGQGTPTTINVLTFSGDGKFLAAGKDFGRVAIWDVSQKKFICAVDTGEGVVTAVAVSKDGQWLATAGQGDSFRAKLWHLPDGKLLRTYDYFSGFVHSLAFGPDGKWIVAWSNDGKSHVLDTAQDKQFLVLDGMFSPLLSSDGQTLMTVSRADYVVWNTADWSKVRTLPRPADFALPLALDTQAGTFVVSSSGRFRLMRLDNGSLLPNSPKLELPRFNPSAGGFAAFRPGTPLLFGHSGDRLWAWNSKTGQTCVSAMMYSESGALSADGSLLVGAKDNSILAQNSGETGVWLWNTDHLTDECFGRARTPNDR